jgi:hypothetical protein
MWADRELRFVEPNRVSIGGRPAASDIHIPKNISQNGIHG